MRMNSDGDSGGSADEVVSDTVAQSHQKRPRLRIPAPIRGAYSVVAALIAIGFCYGYAFSSDVPTGSVRGLVNMWENGAPLPGATITLVPEDNLFSSEGWSDDHNQDHIRVRRAESHADGTFTVAHVTAGYYRVSASSKVHGVESAFLVVEEGKPSSIKLSLSRTEPELALPQHQRIFSTAEEVKLPVRGYVDGKLGRGKDTLSVTIFKTRLSSIVATPAGERTLTELDPGYYYNDGASRPSREIPQALLNPSGGRPAVFVSQTNDPILDADREGFFYKRMKFGKMSPGLYLVDFKHGKYHSATWLLVTDTALLTKQARGEMLAFAVDMTSGAPLPGTTIRAYVKGRLVASSLTDSRGLTNLRVPAPNEENRQLIVATRGDDEAIVRGSGGYYDEGNGGFAVHTYTDRPIYRPGQLVQFKSIIRRVEDPGVRYTVPRGQRVKLEVRDPEGDRVKEEALTTNEFGSLASSVTLSPEARTGVYTLVAKIGKESYTQDFVVASYLKPEFSVKAEPSQKKYVNGDTIEMKVSAEYYFGTPVAGAEVQWSVYEQTDWSAEYPDDFEYDPQSDYEAERYYTYDRYLGSHQRSGTIRLNEHGEAVVRLPANIATGPDAPSAQVFTFSVSVKDESGREVSGQGEASVFAGDLRVTVSPEGYVAEPGKATPVTVSVRDLDGKPVPGTQVSVKGAYYTWKDGEPKEKPFQAVSVTTDANGKAETAITPPGVGEVRITGAAKDRKGRVLYAHASLWSAGDGESDLDTEYGDLSLLTDKRKYAAGDTARVMINSARTGQTVLLTVEGDRIYKVLQSVIRSRSTVFRVPVMAEYGPNVVLAACYVKNKHIAQTQATLRVTQPEKQIRIEIVPDKAANGASSLSASRGSTSAKNRALPVYGPRDRIRYQVRTTDHRGQPVRAELSFGVVDESIYALREDDPSALRDAFYPHRANHVMMDYSFAVAYLGNAAKAEPQITARKKFPDTAYWNPFVKTDGTGKASVVFELPDNLTTWRATATAQTLATTVGRSTSKVLTTKPFIVRVESPRFLTQRDRSQVKAIIHNDTGADQTVLVHFRSKGIELLAPAEQAIRIVNGAKGQIVWPVKATDFERATLDIAAWTPKVVTPADAGGVTASSSQFTDRVERSISVRPHGRERYEQLAGSLSTGKEEVETLRLEDSVIPGATRMRLRVTDTVRGAIAGALPYLIGFPYGCTEQTMSSFLPDLLARRAAGISISVEEGGDLNAMVRNGVARLSRMQHPSGAWGWWEHDDDDPWMTAYVLYGLGSAREQGVKLNRRLLERAVEGGKKMLTKVSDDDKPFLLYGLALAEPREGRRIAAIVDTHLRPAHQSTSGVAYLVLLRKLLGRSTDGALADLDRRGVFEGGMVHWKGEGSINSGWNDRMNTALALRAHLAVDKKHPYVRSALHWLVLRRTGEYWSSTRDTSWVLSSLIDYASAFSESPGAPGDVRVVVNGREVGSDGVWLGGGDRDRVLTIPSTYLQSGKNEVRLTRSGGAGGESFYSLELRKYLGQEGMKADTTGDIKVSREYLRLVPKKAGADAWSIQTEGTGNKLKAGDRIRVRLTIRVPKDMEYVMIEDPFPSGCEPNERGEADDWSYWYSSNDVRDDRIAFFARTMTAGEHVIEYNLRAQTPGEFHALPTFVQPMYAPAVRGESAETDVVVK